MNCRTQNKISHVQGMELYYRWLGVFISLVGRHQILSTQSLLSNPWWASNHAGISWQHNLSSSEYLTLFYFWSTLMSYSIRGCCLKHFITSETLKSTENIFTLFSTVLGTPSSYFILISLNRLCNKLKYHW